MTTLVWSAQDLLVLIKAARSAKIRHHEEQLDDVDFWATLNEMYNNHPDCSSRRTYNETRWRYHKFSKACVRYKKIMDELIEENVFQATRANFDSLYWTTYQETFIGHEAFELWWSEF